ncbi:MAG: histidine kinase [Clostridiales bacterium]|nr:histidine kinase [Clostridiales bacterium]
MKIKIQNSIKFRLFFNYAVLITLMAVIALFSWNHARYYQDQIDEMFYRNLLLDDLKNRLDDVDDELLLYLSTKNSDNLNQYMYNVEVLQESSQRITEQITNFTEEELMFIDIKNMIDEYIFESEWAVDSKRKSNVVGYTYHYNEMMTIKEYVNQYVGELNNRQLSRNASTFDEMSRQASQANLYNMLLIIDLIALSLMIVYKTSNRMIRPIMNLSHSAEEISSGQYDIEDVSVSSNDEIELLAITFNKMKKSIQSHFDDLKEKSETEAKLKDQELENLKMQNLLEQSHMYALQSQMNPHFLFNTINAAVQLSKIESAKRTNEFLESMSRLFRYNVKELHSQVTLAYEVDNIKDYLELLSVRFGEMIRFEFDVDQSGLDVVMPPLILQPFVENAYIHGLSHKETEGHLMITVLDRSLEVEVIISDDGIGMSSSVLTKLFEDHEKVESRYSTGIGIKNVKKRLEMFYKRKDLIKIESTENEGTIVKIILPQDRGDIC